MLEMVCFLGKCGRIGRDSKQEGKQREIKHLKNIERERFSLEELVKSQSTNSFVGPITFSLKKTEVPKPYQ